MAVMALVLVTTIHWSGPRAHAQNLTIDSGETTISTDTSAGNIVVGTNSGDTGILTVTSGTLGPTVHEPVAMAYLAANHAQPQQEVYAEVRGKRLPMRVTPMPFTPHRYHR